MKKNLPFVLTAEMSLEWRESTVAYLRNLYPKMPVELQIQLMAPGVLIPRYRRKGYLLWEPGEALPEAYYLRKGLVKLYSINPKNGFHKIFYIWDAGSIVVMMKAFRERLPSEDYFIEVIENAELVGITNFSMDDIYAEHIAAHEMTRLILDEITENRLKQTDILLLPKLERLVAFEKAFPEFIGRLCVDDICGFLGIGKATFSISR